MYVCFRCEEGLVARARSNVAARRLQLLLLLLAATTVGSTECLAPIAQNLAKPASGKLDCGALGIRNCPKY